MKTKLFSVIVFTLSILSFVVFAQTPQKLKYQAVARDANGNPISNDSIGVQVNILDGALPVFAEQHLNVPVNQFGLFTLEIGSKPPLINPFDSINWASGNKFIKLYFDFNGGTNYTLFGSAVPLLSVPYALYAETTGGSSNDFDKDSTNELQTISKTGNTITLSSGGGSVTDSDNQTLIINGNNLSISGGDTVVLPSGSGTVTQVNTGTGLTGGPIITAGTISLDTTGVVSGTYGASNQIPQITVNPQGQITSAGVLPVPVTSYQTLNINGDTLSITEGNSVVLSDNDNQTLSLSGDSLSLSGGNTVVLPSGSGTVTQVNTGTGLTGGPITTMGTIGLDTTGVFAGIYGSSTQIPQISVNTRGQITSASNLSISSGINGSGTINYLPRFISSTTLTSSQIQDDGVNLSIGTPLNTSVKLDIRSSLSETILVQNSNSNGNAIYAIASAASGVTRGVNAYSYSVNGSGVYGEGGYRGIWGVGSDAGVYGTSGSGYGVFGEATGNRAVYGKATGTNGIGVFGETSTNSNGVGVYAYSSATSGNTYGIYADNYSTSGRAVFGWQHATSGSPFAIIAQCDASSGWDFYAAGSGIDYGTNSSIRWKRNVVTIQNPIDKIIKLRGVYFDWDSEHGSRHDIGFIAEEVGKVIPEIVVYETDSSGYAMGMDYTKIAPLLVEAIKKQQQMINDLKNQIEMLKKELEEVKK